MICTLQFRDEPLGTQTGDTLPAAECNQGQRPARKALALSQHVLHGQDAPQFR